MLENLVPEELSDLEVAAQRCEFAAQELERAAMHLRTAAKHFGNVRFLGRLRICSRRRITCSRVKRWSMNGQLFTPRNPIHEARAIQFSV